MQKPSPSQTRNLVERIRSGDAKAFQTLIEAHQRLVSHIVFRLVPRDSDHEDICQDIFLKVYQKIATFRYEAKLSTWIATIAHNTCINYLQKKKIPLFEDRIPGELTIESIPGEQEEPDKASESKDLAQRLHLEIEKMDVRYRTILTLYHLEEMSYVEIGKVMNLPEGTVKSYLFRARKTLKESLLMEYKREDL
jgi:RNA polymerase sigma-70 factor (ECF subfamily)